MSPDERTALAIRYFPEEWAAVADLHDAKASRRRRSLRLKAEAKAALDPLRAQGASCGSCVAFVRAPGDMKGRICEARSDFHGYTTAKAAGLCLDWKMREGATLIPGPGVCLECGDLATQVVTWGAIYASATPEWAKAKRFILCACGAYVGCHDGTTTPTGRPGKKAVHQARKAAHGAFDPIWRRKAAREACPPNEAREAGYRWLAQQLGIPLHACHIGWMDAATAMRVVAVCSAVWRPKPPAEITDDVRHA